MNAIYHTTSVDFILRAIQPSNGSNTTLQCLYIYTYIMYHYASTYPLIVLLCCYLFERVTLIRINVEKQCNVR